ncbi:MAG: hypothetical protein H6706_23530 [Myxococcales bacterium]|nr:hypothetical protein [Myxococcales bacterium]
MSRLRAAFEEENAFLFALLGLISAGEALPAEAPAPAASAPPTDPVLCAALGLVALDQRLRAALPPLAPPPPAPPATPPPEALLR